jgi:gliding motility-associated-like protein
VICKDDNSGEARVFVEGGTPPFIFNWGGDIDPIAHESFSVISGLFPAVYSVEITDDMGCVIEDSIEIKSNPNICLTIYKVFSPNDDNLHEFWEIENIHLYPKAVVSVYNRNGKQVFRRRNYINSENDAFGGKDVNNQPLPSGTYYYVIDLENNDDVFKGTVILVR